jgi:hypothetical protein
MTRAIAGSRAAIATVAVLLLGSMQPDGHGGAPNGARHPDLGAVFRQGLFLEDQNGDGVTDAIRGRIVLPAVAAPDEIASAANFAARFGFETSALTPGLVATDSGLTPDANTPLLLIGASNRLVTRLQSEGKLDVGSLSPGQGAIAMVPRAFGGADAVVVTGADGAGMIAVGEAASARLPYLWELRSDTVQKVEDDLGAFLADHHLHASTIGARLAVYQRNSERIARLRVQADLDSKADSDAAVRVLQVLADAHGVGKAVFDERAADRLNYYGLDVLEVKVGSAVVAIPRFGPPYKTNFPKDAWLPRPKDLSLATFYAKEGILADDRGKDFIPDRTETTVIVGNDATGAVATVELAARIGMESTGVSLPLVKVERDIADLSKTPNPILIGAAQAVASLPVAKSLSNGEGGIDVVDKAFGAFPAVVVSGGDVAGLNAATSYLAGHVPYVWSTTRGDLDFTQIADEVRQFLRARSGAGQAARATVELMDALDSLKGKTLASLDVKAFLEEGSSEFGRYLESIGKQRTGGAAVTASVSSRYGPVEVFRDSPDLGWEVDELRQRFRDDVLSRVKAGDQVQLDIEVSESPEIRKSIEQDFTNALKQAGVSSPRIRVICAYKQGYSWLTDYVLPEIRGKDVASVQVRFPTAAAASAGGEPQYGLPIRWLQELFPVDEIFARELHLPIDATTFEKADAGPVSYHVEAKNKSGKVVFADDFKPRFVEREYYPLKPVAKLQYTTGGIRATVNGQLLADTHIRTDPERFWDYYQKTAFPRMVEYVRQYTGGDLSARNQPFFRDLIFDITMSEPDFRLNLDEERISSLDSLHEDLMFDTIDFWSILSGQRPGSRNVAPGRIMPMIHPVEPGKPPRVTVTLNGNVAPRPRIDLAWKTSGGEAGTRSIELTDAGLDAPRVLSARIRAGSEQVEDLTIGAAAKSFADMERAARLVEALARMQEAGSFTQALAYDRVNRLSIAPEFAAARMARPLMPRGSQREGRKGAFAAVKVDAGQRIVTWDHVIGPDELEQQIIPKLGAFPEVNSYVAGRTYRGRNVWAMDVMLPVHSTLWSQAKASTMKPVLFVTTRQHSNEVSATSATLRLVELIARDPTYRKYLNRMNIVYHPMENPDGAANHQEFYKMRPTDILHGGYWSAVARDVGAYIWDPDPLLPEALVRRKIYDTWLPDVYMNTHGYPTHEWVHQFAGYKVPWFLAFWIPRGYHINLHHMDDQNYPDHDAVGRELRERIIEEVQGNAAIRATNARLIHRFEKYARRYEPDPFRLEVYKGMNILFEHSYSFEAGTLFGGEIYVNSLSKRPDPAAQSFLERYPQVTVLDLGCDMPDETASPEWMQNMAAPGQLGYLMANVKLLYDSQWKVTRYEEDFADAVHLTMFRPRPIHATRAPARMQSQ